MIIRRLFKREREQNREVTTALYVAIVAAARQPHFYSAWNVPDTPLGRFEMIAVHMILAMRRLTRATRAERDIAQELIDMFFTEVDHSLRELGIGDAGVPKRMKKLAKMFYGRAGAYGAALDERDEAALATALARNIVPTDAEWPFGKDMARYVMRAEDELSTQGETPILAGIIQYPAAGPVQE